MRSFRMVRRGQSRLLSIMPTYQDRSAEQCDGWQLISWQSYGCVALTVRPSQGIGVSTYDLFKPVC